MNATLKTQQAMKAIQKRDFESAVNLLTQCLQTNPGDQQARWLLAQCVLQRGDRKQALEQLRHLLGLAGDNLPAIDRIAGFLAQSKLPLAPALDAYDAFLAGHPDSPNAAFNLAYYLGKDGQFDQAIERYRRALELGVAKPEEVHLNLANIFMDHLQRDSDAEKELEAALELNPRYAAAHFNLGNLFEQRGERDKAGACFEKCLEVEPGNETALARLADSQRFEQPDDPLLKRLDNAGRKSRNSDIHFALGRAYEQLREFDTAWRHFSEANGIEIKALPPYDPAQIERLFKEVGTLCSADWISDFGGNSQETVFICGMFRTGSTLLEQMLGAHPAFVSGGESDFFPRLVAREFQAYPAGLEGISASQLDSWKDLHAASFSELTGGVRRLTDKRPDNFLYIGLIKAVLPSAKFIVTERDWRDVATSIFSTRLGVNQNYSTTLENIRHYIGQQTALVDHWQSVLGPDLIRVHYEDLVGQPRDTVGSVLEALGEDWDDRCLQFNRRGGTVKTASVWQVRQPIHSRSIGRWQNYRPAFEAAFGASLDE